MPAKSKISKMNADPYCLALSLLSYPFNVIGQDMFAVPRQANEYVWVYKPSGDYFFGPDTKHLKEGEWYISSVEWPYRGVSVDKLR